MKCYLFTFKMVLRETINYCNQMLVEQIRTGGDRNFAYVVGDEASGEALVIDPSYWPARVAQVAADAHLTIRYVLNTHRHHDHTNGNEEMEQLTGCHALAFGDSDPVNGVIIEDGVELKVGELTATIIHTPGHTKDCICVLVGDALFTGDTLFVGKVGGTDFGEQAELQYKSLHEKLMTLPPETKVFPGHDVGMAPNSTIAEEKVKNPFLQQPDLESFIHLKRTWLEYKRIHGID